MVINSFLLTEIIFQGIVLNWNETELNKLAEKSLNWTKGEPRVNIVIIIFKKVGEGGMWYDEKLF